MVDEAFPGIAQVIGKKGLKFGHINVNGLVNKLSEIKTLLQESNLSILARWASPSDFPSNHFFHFCRNLKAKGKRRVTSTSQRLTRQSESFCIIIFFFGRRKNSLFKM